MAVGAIGFGGMFAVYSYIAKSVTVVGGLPQQAVPIFLLALGLGMVFGTWPAAFAVTVCGSLGVVNLQLRLMDVAGEAVTLGAAMNHAALNIANALGAWLGGLAIAVGFGYRSTALVGAALAAIGVV